MVYIKNKPRELNPRVAENNKVPLKTKLKIADMYIKQLRTEIGMLESERDEALDMVDELNERLKELQDMLDKKHINLSPKKGEVKKWRKDKFVASLEENNIKLRGEIKKHKQSISELISKMKSEA